MVIDQITVHRFLIDTHAYSCQYPSDICIFIHIDLQMNARVCVCVKSKGLEFISISLSLFI